MTLASELSRLELDGLCLQYEQRLKGTMLHQQLAINCARDYFNSIPDSKLTPELSALREIFDEVGRSGLGLALWKDQLDDLEIMRGEFVTPELQNNLWFDFQHTIYLQTCLLELYYPLAQKLAAQYGFKLPNNEAPLA
jgi:hypothetical protein